MLRLNKPVRTLTVVSLGLVVLFAFGVAGIMGCNGDDEKAVYIKADGLKCTLMDENGSTRIEVTQGQWIVLHNEMAADVELDFSPLQKLFGVVKLVSYRGGDMIKLKVLSDAQVGEHVIRTNCGTTDPPPVIIVNPPGGNDGG